MVAAKSTANPPATTAYLAQFRMRNSCHVTISHRQRPRANPAHPRAALTLAISVSMLLMEPVSRIAQNRRRAILVYLFSALALAPFVVGGAYVCSAFLVSLAGRHTTTLERQLAARQ